MELVANQVEDFAIVIRKSWPGATSTAVPLLSLGLSPDRIRLCQDDLSDPSTGDNAAALFNPTLTKLIDRSPTATGALTTITLVVEPRDAHTAETYFS